MARANLATESGWITCPPASEFQELRAGGLASDESRPEARRQFKLDLPKELPLRLEASQPPTLCALDGKVPHR